MATMPAAAFLRRPRLCSATGLGEGRESLTVRLLFEAEQKVSLDKLIKKLLKFV